MNAYGLDSGMKLETLPIKTVGKSGFRKTWIWLVDQRRVRVLEPFHAPRPDGGSYIIPRGFEFDGGSIPRWLLVLAVIVIPLLSLEGWLVYLLMALVLTGLMIERFGLMLTAFAVHDFAVRYALLVTGEGKVEEIPTVGDANRIMREVNFATNDMKLLGWVAYLAVFSAAWLAWYNHRKNKLSVDRDDSNYGVEVSW